MSRKQYDELKRKQKKAMDDFTASWESGANSSRRQHDELGRRNRENMNAFSASFAHGSKPEPEYYMNSSGKWVRKPGKRRR